ncbi:hypothetical protein PR202_gb26122 [Eleusine coracana subsp. coracana]|uniref:Histidine-containing phosphotransfer protein n=1 Tax=Eleusine coracana subsp. coracana TaxID=191504 RepID=A0AAV5FN78_ELECO|nr:hypothetical protein PR202_gb26122 [Eleusine coracana subsp. coracana]
MSRSITGDWGKLCLNSKVIGSFAVAFGSSYLRKASTVSSSSSCSSSSSSSSSPSTTLDVELLQVKLQDLLHLPPLPLRDPVPVRHHAAGTPPDGREVTDVSSQHAAHVHGPSLFLALSTWSKAAAAAAVDQARFLPNTSDGKTPSVRPRGIPYCLWDVEVEDLQDETSPNFTEEVVSLFFKDSTRLMLNIEQAMEKYPRDFKRWDAHVQQLKGSCSR